MLASTAQSSKSEAQQPDEGGPYVVRSRTFGAPHETFVTSCELYLFGKFVSPRVYPEFGDSAGYLIKKTGTDVTVNGITFFDLKQADLVHRVEPDSALKYRCRVLGEAERQFRERTKAVLANGTCMVDSTLFSEDVPTPFLVNGCKEVVLVTLMKDYIYFQFGKDTEFIPRYPRRAPSKEDRDEQRVDVAYGQLINHLKPGAIVLAGRGYANRYPLAEAELLKAALAKIPRLARPIQEDLYGRMVYEMIEVDGFKWASNVIRDFVNE